MIQQNSFLTVRTFELQTVLKGKESHVAKQGTRICTWAKQNSSAIGVFIRGANS